MKKFFKIFVPAAFVLIAVMASCTSDCFMPTRSLFGVAFVDSLTLKSVTINRLSVQGEGSDSILYNNVNVSEVYLPLHVKQGVTVYNFTIASGSEEIPDITFKLTVNHTPRAQFVSPECGCLPMHTVNSVECEQIDIIKSEELIKTEVTNVEKDVHLKIYF